MSLSGTRSVCWLLLKCKVALGWGISCKVRGLSMPYHCSLGWACKSTCGGPPAPMLGSSSTVCLSRRHHSALRPLVFGSRVLAVCTATTSSSGCTHLCVCGGRVGQISLTMNAHYECGPHKAVTSLACLTMHPSPTVFWSCF